MKKTRFFTLALLSAAVIFTSSCKDDEDAPLAPTLSVTETHTNKTGGAVEIEQGDALEFAWESRKGDNNIKTFSMSMSGNNISTNKTTYRLKELPYTVTGGDKSIYVDTISFQSAGLNLGSTNYTFTSSDGTNSKSVSFNVTVVPGTGETTQLTDATSFEWKRVGGNDGTGLAMFGLKWTNNTTTKAIVAVNGATMYSLPASAWTSILTQEGLALAISAATSITKYEGVSVTQDGTYDDVLAVAFNGTNYLLHITNGVVQTGGAGTTVTIGGKYKK